MIFGISGLSRITGIAFAIILGVGSSLYANWDIIQVEEAKRAQRILDQRNQKQETPTQ